MIFTWWRLCSAEEKHAHYQRYLVAGSCDAKYRDIGGRALGDIPPLHYITEYQPPLTMTRNQAAEIYVAASWVYPIMKRRRGCHHLQNVNSLVLPFAARKM